MASKQFGFINIVCSTGEIALDYDDYLYTKHWLQLRERIFALRKQTCERCHRKIAVYQVHHKTYERIGHEHDGDLQLLCVKCHERVHILKSKKMAKRIEREKARKREIKALMVEKPVKYHCGKYYDRKKARVINPVITIKLG